MHFKLYNYLIFSAILFFYITPGFVWISRGIKICKRDVHTRTPDSSIKRCETWYSVLVDCCL